MPVLKDFIETDMKVFFNLDEFAVTHVIDGRQLDIVIDNDQLKELNKKEYDGISIGEILYYVKAIDYGKRPEQGTLQIFDGRQMYVLDSKEDNGIYEIILQQNRGF